MRPLTHVISKIGIGKTLGTPPLPFPEPLCITFRRYDSASMFQTEDCIKNAAVEAGEAIKLPSVL